MSVQALAWAFGTKEPRLGERLVLLALADYADAAHASWPKISTLAEKANLSENATREAIRRLEAMGLVYRAERRVESGRNLSNRYYLAAPNPVYDDDDPYAPRTWPQPGGQPPATDTLPDAGGDSPPATVTHMAPASVTHLGHGFRDPESSDREPSSDPPIDPSGEASPPQGFDAFWAAWPRKVGKPKALAAWGRALRRSSAEVIVTAAIAYRDNPYRPDPEFIPHPTTWLNRDGWDDDLPTRPTASSRPRQLSVREQNMQYIAEMERREAAEQPREIGL